METSPIQYLMDRMLIGNQIPSKKTYAHILETFQKILSEHKFIADSKKPGMFILSLDFLLALSLHKSIRTFYFWTHPEETEETVDSVKLERWISNIFENILHFSPSETLPRAWKITGQMLGKAKS